MHWTINLQEKILFWLNTELMQATIWCASFSSSIDMAISNLSNITGKYFYLMQIHACTWYAHKYFEFTIQV
jgi:hypothetical protein